MVQDTCKCKCKKIMMIGSRYDSKLKLSPLVFYDIFVWNVHETVINVARAI